jgi:hypothetical protein
MQVKGLAKLVAGTALVATLGLATEASALPKIIVGTGFGGIAGNGDSGTDAFGQPWTWGYTKGTDVLPAGLSAWGNPGLGDGELTGYAGSRPATAFYIVFLTSGDDSFINTTASPMPGGYDEETRMTVNGVAWTPVFKPAVDPLGVGFIAPAGSQLVPGEDYFINVIFTNGDLSGANAGFSAVFASTVPEVSTWALMLLGVGAVGGTLRNARRRHATESVGA